MKCHSVDAYVITKTILAVMVLTDFIEISMPGGLHSHNAKTRNTNTQVRSR